MEKTIGRNNHFCALCRNWNNGRGADTLKPKGMNSFSVDNTEEHPCIINSFKRKALNGGGCHDFASRF